MLWLSLNKAWVYAVIPFCPLCWSSSAENIATWMFLPRNLLLIQRILHVKIKLMCWITCMSIFLMRWSFALGAKLTPAMVILPIIVLRALKDAWSFSLILGFPLSRLGFVIDLRTCQWVSLKPKFKFGELRQIRLTLRWHVCRPPEVFGLFMAI